MKVGTKSVLFGAHCFFIHPWFVAAAWTKLYGFPLDPRLWVAFFVHDLGYFGKPNMDGAEGETHVELGAKIMGIFGKRWALFTMYHSRFYAKKNNAQPSRLCIADKYSICLEPAWLYLPRVIASGEIIEYMQLARQGKYKGMVPPPSDRLLWFNDVVKYLSAWVEEHKTGNPDTWT